MAYFGDRFAELREARSRSGKKALLPPEEVAEVKDRLTRVMKENRLPSPC
jgi:hypothetical protein